MKLNQNLKIFTNQIAIFAIGLLFLLINALIVNGQSTATIQSQMLFGSFINNVPLGGTAHLVLASDASATVTADPGLIEISSSPQSAACMRIYFTKNDNHHYVTITYGPQVYLKNGNYSILFTPPAVGKFYNYNWSNAQSSYWDVYIGGTLAINSPSNDPAGTYSGTFKVYYTYTQF